MTEPVAISVQESGDPDGTVLVLVHGIGNSHRTFGFLPAELLARHRVVRVDLRGHGGSPRTPGGYRLDGYAADVEAVLVGAGPAVLVGHSLGAVVAWTLAQRRPDLVSTVLLEDLPLYARDAPTQAMTFFRDLADMVASWQRTGLDATAVAAELASLPAPGRSPLTTGEVQFADGVLARARGLLDADPDALRAVADGTSLDAVDTATSPARPVRVLAADPSCGGVLAEHDADRLRRDHPDVTLRRLAGSGHAIHDELAHRETWLDELRAVLP